MAKPMKPRSAAEKPAAKASKNEAKKPAPAKGLRSRAVDPEKIRAAYRAARASGGGGPKVPYMKFTPGQTRVRLIPLPDSEVPFLHFRAHNLRPAGSKYPQTMLDYRWLAQEEQSELLGRLMADGKITQADIDAALEFGEAATEVAAAAKENKIETKRSLWAGNKYLFLALDRGSGEVRVFEAGKKFAVDFLEPLIAGVWDDNGELTAEATHPELFDLEEGFDILVTATGEGLQRRYSYTVDRRASSVDLDGLAVPDPYEVISRYAKPYRTKVAALFSQEGEIARSLGFTPEQFGGMSAGPAQDDDGDDPLGDAF